MDPRYRLIIWLVIWLAVVMIGIINSFRKGIKTIGLPIAFMFVFSLDHWFGAFVNSLPWFVMYEYDFVVSGFIVSTYALMAFLFGNMVLAPFFIRAFRFRWLRGGRYVIHSRLPIIYLIIGLIFYFALKPLLENIESIRTLSYSGWSIMTAAICLGCWDSWRRCNQREFSYWLAFAFIAPFFTMVNSGFLGVGTITLLVILSFVAIFYRPRWQLVLGVAAAIYLGLSMFVNYMEYRTELRETVWGIRPVSERLEVVEKMVKNFKFINMGNENHLNYIDRRLNQNNLVGAAIAYMKTGYETYANGETILDAVYAIIPRIVWPDKPMRLGGSQMVTKYTGIEFGDDVSVAIGLVMEAYINFSTLGVIIIFIMLGIIITLIDIACKNRLMNGDWYGFTYLFLPGISIILSTSFLHLSVMLAAAIVFCIVVNKFLLPQLGVKRIPVR